MEDVNNNDKYVNDVCLNEDLIERFQDFCYCLLNYGLILYFLILEIYEFDLF